MRENEQRLMRFAEREDGAGPLTAFVWDRRRGIQGRKRYGAAALAYRPKQGVLCRGGLVADFVTYRLGIVVGVSDMDWAGA